MRGLVVGFLVVAVAFAGCAQGDAAGTKGGAAPPPAAIPVANETAASISGRVLDEEQLPVVGARVYLKEKSGIYETDVNGNFTVNELETGVYTVLVEKLGFESFARKVPVQVGEVSRLTVVLKMVAVALEGYITSQPFQGYINFGQAYFDYYLGWDSRGTCSKCEFYAFLAPKPMGMKFEASWQKSVGAPLISEDIYYLVRKNWNNDTLTSQDNSANTRITSGYWVFGQMPRNMEEPDHAEAKTNLNAGNVTKLKIRIGGGFDGVAYEQKVEMWLSFAYVEEFPEDFSAFPPPG